MWDAYRGDTYRTGYTESVNGLKLTCISDQVALDVSCSEWDSEVVKCIYVFAQKGKQYILYRSNDYGEQGF
jgi:hypothetical protein